MGTKLDRKNVKIFAENSDATLITEFRSESADGSTASFSRDPDVIQNANYEQGWVENQNNLNTKIFGENMNAVSYVQSYLLKYLYENGIPEWSANTEYFEHSIARVDDRLFISLTDNNVNNDPTNTVGEWAEIPLSAINIVTSGTGSSIFNTSSGNNITLKSLSVDGYASLQDNGDQINIHVIGGSGIVDAYWGQIQGTLTNQADLVSALGDKQDNLTFDSPLSVDVNNEVSIPKATDSISGYLDSTDFQTFAGKQNALSGFEHSYTSGTDTAQIYPTATNSNIGTDTYPITATYVNNVHCKTKLYVNEIDERTGDTVSVSSKLSVAGDTSVGGNLSVTGTTTLSGATTINSHLSVSNTIKMTKGQVFSWQDGGTDVAEFYTGGSGELTLNSNAQSLTTNCKINAFFGGNIQIASGIINDKNGNSLQIYPENRGTNWDDQKGDGMEIGDSDLYGEIAVSSKRGAIWFTGSGWSTTPSSREIKKNINDHTEEELSKINAIKMVDFNYKTEKDNDQKHFGFIAEEVEKIIPKAVFRVKENPDDKKESIYMVYEQFIPYLVKSVQELSAKVDGLEKRVAELEGKNNKELEK